MEFEQYCQACIREDHSAARAAGEPWPEVHWAGISRRSLPALASLTDERLDVFLAAHAALLRTCSPMPGAGEFIHRCRTAGLITGLASNAQPYTRHEMRLAGLETSAFHPVFLSGDHGYAKPSPRLYEHLTEKLAAMDVPTDEILMVGDRYDNDVTPALDCGWQAWHYSPEPGRDFAALTQFLFPQTTHTP